MAISASPFCPGKKLAVKTASKLEDVESPDETRRNFGNISEQEALEKSLRDLKMQQFTHSLFE